MATASSTLKSGSGFASAFAALCVGAVAMGISPIFVRFAAADVGPYASAFWRVALSLPIVYAWMRIEERPGSSERPLVFFSRASILAGLAFTGDLFFWHLSILRTTVANATFFAAGAPLFVILITWLVLKQRIQTGTVVGLLICLAGGAALIGQSLQVHPDRLQGDLFGIATALPPLTTLLFESFTVTVTTASSLRTPSTFTLNSFTVVELPGCSSSHSTWLMD